MSGREPASRWFRSSVFATGLATCLLLQLVFWFELVFDKVVTFHLFILGYGHYAILFRLVPHQPTAVYAIAWSIAYVAAAQIVAVLADRFISHQRRWLSAIIIWVAIESALYAVIVALDRYRLITIE